MRKVKLKANKFSDEELNLIINSFGLTEVSANILLNRGLKTVEEIERFLNPKLDFLENTDNYKDVEKACKRILSAVHNNEKIMIYGDYDVDGTTSISQFVIFLRKIGVDVDYYVPERESEGYGISENFIDQIEKNNIKLLITVDCGISEVDSIDKINLKNIDIILIDHHQCGEVIPRAFAVINPKQPDCPSINKTLCASGLTYKFLLHLNRYLNVSGVEDILLELACLGTVADIVDLIGDNRIITFNGLKNINNTRLLGIKKLIEKAGINDREIEAYHIGYILAPRINAAGRMASARVATELLLAEDEETAEKLASSLEEYNALRKHTEQIIFNEAVEKIEVNGLHKKSVIVVAGEMWHEGVLGIVASRLTEKYSKPSIVFSIKEETGKASARSVEYLDIFEMLSSVKHLLLKYGGHKLAAGLSIKKECINEFAIELNKYAGKFEEAKETTKLMQVDAFVSLIDIEKHLFDEIKQFEPFGQGNQRPIFAVEEFLVTDLRRVGKEKNHVSFFVKHENKCVKVIAFDKLYLLEKIISNPKKLVVNISENTFRGIVELQMTLLDIEDFEFENIIVDENKSKAVISAVNKSKSKIIKANIFEFSDNLSKSFHINLTVTDIINILRNNAKLEFVLKNDIIYIKK